MQELRLVAVSEDGTYLVLATAGRGTRFTLPVDDRLRAAVRGHFSRLGQFEIEVESPLRPKEIQARIRSGETAEEIAESAGIPVERVRWFEGPVLQEREYMAQQAQRVAVRRPGESSPGPPLGETVEQRLGRGGVDLEEVEWDSWKCEDSTWRVRLSFFDNGRPHAAEWVFEPRRRIISPLDEVAARLTAVEWDDDALGDTVTPLVPRRPAMKVVSDSRDLAAPPPAPRGIGTSRPVEYEPERASERAPERAERAPEPLRAAAELRREPPVASRPVARHVQEEPLEERSAPEPPAAVAAPVPVPRPAPEDEAAEPEPEDEPAAEVETPDAPAKPEEPAAEETHEPESEPEQEPVAEAEEAPEAVEDVQEEEPQDEAAEEAPESEPAAEAEADEEEAPEAEPEPQREPEQERPAAREKAPPAPKPQRATTRAPAKKKSTGRPTMPPAPIEKPAPAPAPAPAAPAAPAAAAAASASDTPAQRPARNRRKSKAKRASVPSWDEIMFGARRPE
ncbi:septation protein SepH [Actinomadura sp. 9N407]|uniref:septation protein SepH n=1 Tax=Actinomadura sp. 9N407 TaxID=3375154 RepID=UPI00378EC4FE